MKLQNQYAIQLSESEVFSNEEGEFFKKKV